MSDSKEAKELKEREPGIGPGRRKTVRKGMFSRDCKYDSRYKFDHQLIIYDLVKLLMYGFGDVANPAADSIAVMDDLVIDYITEMVIQYIIIIW